MPRTESWASLVAAAALGLLAWAAVSDLRSRRIPNAVIVQLFVLFVPWVMATGQSWTSSVAAAAIALAVGFALFAFGFMGGGDGKLFAACALFAGLEHLGELAALTAMAGGAMALATFAARPTRVLVAIQMRGAGGTGLSLPYGVAIAVGASWMIVQRLLAARGLA